MLEIQKHPIRRVLALIAALLLWHGAAVAQTVVNVTAGNAADLVSKVNAATSGTVVNIPAGTYNIPNCSGWGCTALQIRNGVTLQGSGASQTKLVFNGNGARLANVIGGADTTRMKDLSVNVNSNWYDNGGIIYASGNTVKLVIENCNMTGKIGHYGGAVYLTNGAFVKVVNTDIYGCNAAYGGVFSVNNSTLHVYNCKMYNNSATGNGEGGVFNVNAGIVKIVNSQMYDNLVSGNGQGGAGYFSNHSTVTLEGCTILNGSALNGGAGFYLNGANTLVLSYCTMAGNKNVGGNGAGGVAAGNQSEITISNSVVTGNSSGNSLGNDLPSGVTVDIEGSIVGDELIVSTDPDADCQPNCNYVIPNADSIIQKDANGNVVVNEDGNITITLPDTLQTPSGDPIVIAEIPDMPTDENGNPTFGSGEVVVQSPPTLSLRISDSMMCAGDSVTFSLRLRNMNGTVEYRFYKIIDENTKTLLGTRTNNTGRATFGFVMQNAAVAKYICEVYSGANLELTSNEMPLIVIPIAKSSTIEHSKNTVDN